MSAVHAGIRCEFVIISWVVIVLAVPTAIAETTTHFPLQPLRLRSHVACPLFSARVCSGFLYCAFSNIPRPNRALGTLPRVLRKAMIKLLDTRCAASHVPHCSALYYTRCSEKKRRQITNRFNHMIYLYYFRLLIRWRNASVVHYSRNRGPVLDRKYSWAPPSWILVMAPYFYSGYTMRYNKRRLEIWKFWTYIPPYSRYLSEQLYICNS